MGGSVEEHANGEGGMGMGHRSGCGIDVEMDDGLTGDVRPVT